ncbi:MAG: NAD+ synthase [Alphaproteobacteria bacterium]|nr:NAD+ synthase [Alphaproteobacteria bacterium]
MNSASPLLRIVIAQTNPCVGDITGNLEDIEQHYLRACSEAADIIVFPELAITGYDTEDLTLRPAFHEAAVAAVKQLARLTFNTSTALIVGTIWQENGQCFNAGIMLYEGDIYERIFKYSLPNYGVFDEHRVFVPGPLPSAIEFKNCKIGLLICEDLWENDVPSHYASQGVELLICINASPFEVDKKPQRLDRAIEAVTIVDAPLIYVNSVGAQDELVFDGQSFVLSINEEVNFQLAAFEPDYASILLHHKQGCWQLGPARPFQEEEGLAQTYRALQIGLRDYVEKNNFKSVVLGLSGGIDSAFVAVLAVDALGSDRVHCVTMPSPYTANETLQDSLELAQNLGCRIDTIPIHPLFEGFQQQLAPIFRDVKSDVTEENMQSRIRGLLLMSISNKFGSLVLATGNKSEMATGYSTLYGDMCGGFAPIKDVYKTEIYTLSTWRNRQTPIIPESIIARAPTAELRPNQTDQDTLPPYHLLDKILYGMIEENFSSDELIAAGFDRAMVHLVAKLLCSSEYKRYQAPPGTKISCRAFGKDWRYPLTNHFRF